MARATNEKHPFDIEEYKKRVARYFGKDKEKEKLFSQALNFADTLHRGVERQSGEPYISHPCAVAEIILKEFRLRDPQLLAASLLHDVVEDVPQVTIGDIEKEFGTDVAEIVDGCTKLRYLGADRAALKDLTHSKFFLSAANKPEILVVKLADRLHNLRTLKFLPRPKRQRIARETVDIYAPVAAKLNIYPLKRELYHLSLSYLFPRKSKQLLAEIKRLRQSEIVAVIKKNLAESLSKHGVGANIRSRVKGLGNYYDPVKKTLSPDNAENRVDFVIIIEEESPLECYKVLGILNLTLPPLPRTLRDFIAHPKSNGYRSIHTRSNIMGEQYLFKIRTPEMDLFANQGILAEWEKRGEFSKETWQEILEIFRNIGEYKGGASRRKEIIRAAEGEEIIVYTPNGDIHYLPKGSIVLDFAYKIHTEIGNCCIGAKIGGHVVKPDHQLKDGDVVEVITSDKPTKIVDMRLERLARTAKARVNINRKINRERREFAAKVGESILKQEIAHHGLSEDILQSDKATDVLDFMRLDNLKELFVKIGQDAIKPGAFVYYFVNISKDKINSREIKPGSLKQHNKRNKIYVNNLDSICYKFSQCCHPYPGQDNVVGLLSERGVSFHREDCFQLVRYNVDPSDMLEIIWDPSTPLENHQIRITFPNTDSSKLFRALAGVDHDVVIRKVTKKKTVSKKTPVIVDISIPTISDLKHVINTLPEENFILNVKMEH